MVNTDDEEPTFGIVLVIFHRFDFFLTLGLVYFSEQAFESMHHDAKVTEDLLVFNN